MTAALRKNGGDPLTCAVTVSNGINTLGGNQRKEINYFFKICGDEVG